VKASDFDGCYTTGCGVLIVVAIVLGLVVGIPWFSAAQESSTYNRLTGAHTTTWDALWVELRVQEGTKQ